MLYHPGKGYAQFNAQKADSLEAALTVAETPLDKVNILFELEPLYEYEDSERAKRFLFDALEIAEAEGLILQISKSKATLSRYYLASNNWDTMILLNQQGLDLINGLGMEEAEANHLSYLGLVAEERGQYSEAIDYNTQALSRKMPVRGQMIMHNNLGNLYNSLEYYDKALFHLLTAKTLADSIGNIYGASAISTNIGNSYSSLGKLAEAKQSFEQAIELKGKLGDEYGKIYGLLGLAGIYAKRNQYELSTKTYEACLDIARQNGNRNYEILTLDCIGNNYINLEDYDSAIETYTDCLSLIQASDKKDQYSEEAFAYKELSWIYNKEKQYRKALDFAKKAVLAARAIEREVSEAEVKALYQLSEAYHYLGQSDLAYETILEHNILKDSLEAIKNLKEARTLELKYNVSEKEKEMSVLEAEKNAEIKAQKTTNQFFSILAGIALLIAVLLFFFLRQRTRQQKQLQIQHTQISEQHRIISQQANELQELDSLKSRLFANVSHELRTPLTLILGPLSSALKEQGLSNKTSTFLQLAKQNGQKLLQLINEILDLSKMDAGKLELQEQAVLLLPFLRRLLAQFESHAQDRAVELLIMFEPDPYLKIKLDTHKFELIFNNLLSNALKFTPREGTVSITIRHLGNRLALEVKDTGPGIHEEDLGHIFDRFYQASHSDSGAEGGTGIGLALCHEYARLFSGEMQVESTLGEGSLFRFLFPLKEILGAFDEKESPTEVPIVYEEEKPANLLSDKHLLLVEDNFSLRTYIQAVLKDQYKMTTAENGKVALELLEDANFQASVDLIISDVMMPVMDGFQLLDQLKAHDVWRSIPVVMLTARAAMADKLKALRIGVDDYMTKPFEEEELLARIENLLRNAQERRIVKESGFAEGPSASEEETEQEKVIPISAEDREWLEKLEQLTKAFIPNFGFTLDVLGHEIGYSRRQLHRKIKALTGLNPNQYIVEVRMQQARMLLETQGVTTVKAASYEVGMKDTKYFSKLFKQRFGKSPSAFFANPM
ncbi:MAG: ATP-binding protein [Bacteroidota bacterium]